MSTNYILDISWFFGLFSILALIFMLMLKSEKIKQLNSSVSKLQKSLEEMDEQAKLIVRTDIELNKTQEELDKKITGLYALQRLSRAISATLEEGQIFKAVGPAILEDMGFEKVLIFLWDERQKKFERQLVIGFAENQLPKIDSFIDSGKNIFLDLINNQKTTSSSKLSGQSVKERIESNFSVDSFIISPILPKEGCKGVFFVGEQNQDMAITEGDEELIAVVSDEIGQALENARLFEKTWKAQAELEQKVEERTRALTSVLEEVKRISKLKTDFISSVSHELRTPLTSIKGYAAILLEEKLGALPQAVKERLERVNHHSNELVNMVNDLLDISRIESGKATMTLEKQDLKNIIAAASDLILIQCKNKNIELAQDIRGDLPAVSVDRSQIERVFINLLGNAVKFTPEKGKITIKAFVNDGFVRVDIQDSGIGIPPESLSLIFDEFYRVDNPINQQVKGTGLGLSLVKHIIEAHKGKIWAESRIGKGTTFSLTLPVT